MRICKILVAMFFCWGAGLRVASAEVAERETFGKWHVGVGAAFNVGVKANVGLRNLPVPQPYSIPVGSTLAEARERTANHQYDGGGYIADDGRDGDVTENWKLPVSNYRGDGVFELENAYQEILDGSTDNRGRDSANSEMQYGISAEIAREIWIHDENDEHRWGVDFAAAFSYFFRRDLYKAQGRMMRTDSVRDGVVPTVVTDPNAMADYDVGISGEEVPADHPVDDLYYGHGNAHYDLDSPALSWNAIENRPAVAGAPYPVVSSYGYHASGDYRELEMLFMFRPWYEITDWWRIYAEVGVGVSWGRFDVSFSGNGISAKEKFSQWDCYGVAGLGTSFRYDDWTLGIDFLGRFWRDDLDVDGRYVSGSIERSDWGFRVMLGYEF